MAIYSEFSHEKLWFSIVMLVYQRVTNWFRGTLLSDKPKGRKMEENFVVFFAVVDAQATYWGPWMEENVGLSIARFNVVNWRMRQCHTMPWQFQSQWAKSRSVLISPSPYQRPCWGKPLLLRRVSVVTMVSFTTTLVLKPGGFVYKFLK